MEKLNYEKVFNTLIHETRNYIQSNNCSAMVLGISGGIDSTVVAAICHEVSKQTGIPLIGRSLPIKNKKDEVNVSKLVGGAFCSDFIVYNLRRSYEAALLDSCRAIGDAISICIYNLDELEEMPSRTPIANGNLQARCRMQHLYDLAGINKGLVISTDNQTEYQLGFWTLHGDVGDFNPLFGLWKTEVYGLAKWLSDHYKNTLKNLKSAEEKLKYCRMYEAINESIDLTPTDGLGISNSDLDQIGAKSYEEVESILNDFLAFDICSSNSKEFNIKQYLKVNALYDVDSEVIKKVLNRHLASEFKRKNLPIVIEREKYTNF